MHGPLPNVLTLIGNTPLVELKRVGLASGPRLLGKLEGRNPTGSVKDRVALAMIEDAERRGLLQPGSTLVEATSGNTAVSLALVGAVKGYKVAIVAPDSLPPERGRLLNYLGAEVELTPSSQGMAGAHEAAEGLVQQRPNTVRLHQFQSPANAQAHRDTTAQEVLRDADGRVDALVAGVGTGGTITGVGEVLKAHNPEIRVVAVEPAASPTLGKGWTGPHRIPGLGADFVPPILNRDIIDEIVAVGDGAAAAMTLRLAREEGLMVGLSSGAALHAALEVARRMPPEATIVVILPDAGPKYVPPPLL